MRTRLSIEQMVLLGVVSAVVLSLIVFTVLLGPLHALRIAEAAFLRTVVDRVYEHAMNSGSPTLELRGVGASGFEEVPTQEVRSATLIADGVEHPATVQQVKEYEDLALLLIVGEDSPLAPYSRVLLRAPADASMLNATEARWLCERVGALVPWGQLMSVAVDGEAPRLLEVSEVIGPDFARNRNLSMNEVVVLPLGGSGVTGSAQYERIRVCMEQCLSDTTTSHAWADSLAASVDRASVISAVAALQLLGGGRVEENCSLVEDPVTKKFHLAVRSPRFREVEDTTARGPWQRLVMEIPAWRAAYDSLLLSLLEGLDSSPMNDIRTMHAARIRPIVLSDRQKRAVLSSDDPLAYPISVVHVERAQSELHRRMDERFHRLRSRITNPSPPAP